ncbi:multiple cyclophane-containing RiPP AmcA [Micromonospora sp. CPCC 206060]|uniref:multiple cyclophane-containing RiPP AmcA n=1 Tax=Micromonospora sp. CPCC 206060 TaxID=3122406 RepID=UPI002FF42E0F
MAASPPHPGGSSNREPAVTVYISRNATMGGLPRDRVAAAPPVRPGSADPPLLTHAWRIVFERQTRESERR